MAFDDYAQWIKFDVTQAFRKAAFTSGDGYPVVQTGEIPGPENESVNLTWRFINQDDFQDFLDEFYVVGYHGSFDITIPGAGSSAKYRFSSVSETAVSPSQWTVAATLERFHGV